ncbi:hypothetical protein [Paenibacillus sp. IITD108]|uniref:hypothetical protein n=1 Tax=Paenibacillus sp. IITD108 TaxID=3116649 RepID=UPI002F3ECF3E
MKKDFLINIDLKDISIINRTYFIEIELGYMNPIRGGLCALYKELIEELIKRQSENE